MIMNDDLKTSKRGLELIAKWEGLVLTPYRDIAGLLTVGYGHLIKPGEKFDLGKPITRERALELLADDVKKCEDAIKQDIKVELSQNQFDALVSFGFNCGTGVYKNSGVARAVNAGDFSSVPARLEEWSKARVKGVMQVVPGLLARRKHEGQVFRTPYDQENSATEDVLPWSPELAKDVQGRLLSLGHYTGKIDGIIGPKSLLALSAYAAYVDESSCNFSQGVNRTLLDRLRSDTGG